MAGAAGQEVDLTGVMVSANLTVSDYFIVAPVVIPILFGAILMMLRSKRNWQAPIAIAGFAIALFAEFGLLQQVIAEGPRTMTMGRWLPPFGISFTVDLTGALFAFTGGVVALAGAIYSWRDVTPTGRRYGFYPFFMLMMPDENYGDQMVLLRALLESSTSTLVNWMVFSEPALWAEAIICASIPWCFSQGQTE